MRGQFVRQLGHLAQQHPRTLDDQVAGRGRDHAARQAMEDGRAEQRLHFAQPLADRGRAQMQPLARRPHVAGIGQGTDEFELAHSERGQQAVCRIVHTDSPGRGARLRVPTRAYSAEAA
ncbi:hypothetical protein GCM10009097_12280 [Pigmentiphaga daeguensis]|uniref:Uncharacterized protein n=1 Tax=Pigmentiphaga daeguensis TaxID=414049 RepID=A0ABN1BGT0_9BURK